MTRLPESDPPLEVNSVEADPAGKEQVIIRVRVKGRWRRRETAGRALLVLQANGRKHRFPAVPEARRARFGRPGAWSASFALPAWLASRLMEDAVLWVDNSAIPLPPPDGELPDVPAPAEEPELVAPLDGIGEADDVRPEVPVEDANGPKRLAPIELADRIRREVEPEPNDLRSAESNGRPDETLGGLRSELQQRAVSEARLRGELARVRAELEARNASHERVERTHEELRAELEELRALVASLQDLAARRAQLANEVGELRAKLAAISASRDAARWEAEELRTQLDRVASQRPGADGGTQLSSRAIEEAEALLAEARSLRTRIGHRDGGSSLRAAERV